MEEVGLFTPISFPEFLLEATNEETMRQAIRISILASEVI